ncbi:hypothetical protein KXQ82_17290 [Mucilaginibacter sp. HMF5004]|uniref:hypothetical protein n=1 Tax=Mucilaginibacter rivuli TaxID=2857527 RepID=UPI001C5F2F13|nr:hypothetical protein [Mucilaginibacter rivuli]MBW4891486.1 hypothetical protein [Mucilaginibacter rivuli]
MELLLRSNDKNSIDKIINLAKKLNVIIERKDVVSDDIENIELAKKRVLNFKAQQPPSIGDPVKWQQEQRQDRDLPFSK